MRIKPTRGVAWGGSVFVAENVMEISTG